MNVGVNCGCVGLEYFEFRAVKKSCFDDALSYLRHMAHIANETARSMSTYFLACEFLGSDEA